MIRRDPNLVAQEAIHNILPRAGMADGVRDGIGAFRLGLKEICEASYRLDRGAIPSVRQNELKRLMKARGLTREKLRELADISSGTLDNVMKEEFRCSKQVAYRLMIVLCENISDMEALYPLFGYAPLPYNAADQLVRYIVENQCFDKVIGLIREGDRWVNAAESFWALLLSLLQAYGGSVSAEFGTLNKALRDILPTGGDDND